MYVFSRYEVLLVMLTVFAVCSLCTWRRRTANTREACWRVWGLVELFFRRVSNIRVGFLWCPTTEDQDVSLSVLGLPTAGKSLTVCKNLHPIQALGAVGLRAPVMEGFDAESLSAGAM